MILKRLCRPKTTESHQRPNPEQRAEDLTERATVAETKRNEGNETNPEKIPPLREGDKEETMETTVEMTAGAAVPALVAIRVPTPTTTPHPQNIPTAPSKGIRKRRSRNGRRRT